MRELKSNEVYEVSGAAWWSPSNILGFFRGLGHSSSESTPGLVPNVPTPDSGHIGKAIGIGVVMLAGVAVVASLFGISTVAKNIKL
ncbi:hypothetical protein ACFL9S_17620 [Erwinia sp. AnSW2-5]|uniref:hypothetical protein n=1 Tax=Erwinia sp. AnSW2-5 TaxID=3367692 RepID=UPI003858491F